jgi:hypothetical protein
MQVRLDRTFKTLDQLIATDEDMAACYLTVRQETGAPAPPDEHMQVAPLDATSFATHVFVPV